MQYNKSQNKIQGRKHPVPTLSPSPLPRLIVLSPPDREVLLWLKILT